VGDTRKKKMYFHVVYGGGRRRYGGAGKNSPKTVNSAYLAQPMANPSKAN